MPQPGQPNPNLIERLPDGSFTKETLQRAMKAFKKRLKLTRLDDESRLGHDAMSKGGRSGITGVRPPEQYPPEVWRALVEKGRLRSAGQGVYEIIEQPGGD
jgi:hypothetical protein